MTLPRIQPHPDVFRKITIFFITKSRPNEIDTQHSLIVSSAVHTAHPITRMRQLGGLLNNDETDVFGHLS